MPSDPTVRVSDHDREQVVDRLGEQVGWGRLGLDEFDQRAAAAYAAATRGELDDLLADLPAPRPPSPRSPVHARREAQTMATVLGAAQRRGSPWASWLLVGAICLIIWVAMSLTQGQLLSFWPGWVIGPWGAVLLSRHLTGRTAGCCGWVGQR